MASDKKKIIFIVICVLIVIIAVTVALLTFGRKKQIAINADDMPVSAYYVQDGNDIKVYLDYPKGTDYRWNAVCDNNDVTEVKDLSSSKKNVFIISSKKALTMSNVKMTLQDKNDSSDIIYEINLGLFSGKKKKIAVKEVNCAKVDSMIKGEIAGSVYKIISDTEGGIKLVIEANSENPGTWDYEYDGSLLSIGGPADSAGTFSFVFRAFGNGEEEITEESVETVYVYSEELLSKLTLTLRVTPDHAIHIDNQEAGSYEIKKVLDEEAKKNFTEKYGEISLPSKALKADYKIKALRPSNDAEESVSTAVVEFYVDGVKAEIVFTDEYSDESAFIWRYNCTSLGTKTINGVSAALYSLDGDIIATWTKDGRIYEFVAEGISENDAAELLKEIV